MIKTVIFDFFGVISSEVAPFWFAERFCLEDAKRLKDEYMSPADRGEVTIDALFDSLSSLSGEAAEKIRSDFFKLAVIDKNMVSLIRALSEKYKIVLLSNAEYDFLDEIMRRDNLYGLFDYTVISGKEKIAKPDTAIFKLALSRSGAIAEESVFIDDNPKNTDAARSVGINAIVFDGVENLMRELEKLGVIYD